MNDRLHEVGVPSNLVIGTRFPNISMPTMDGSGLEYHRDIKSKPTLFCIARRAEDIEAEIAVVAGVAPGKLNILSIAPDTSDTGVEEVHYLEDRNCLVAAHIGLAEQSPKAIVLADANQRIVSMFDGTTDLGEWLKRHLKTLEFARAEIARDFAPVLSIPRALDRDFCDELMEIWRGDHEEGRISGTVKGQSASLINPDLKRRLDHVVDKSSPLYRRIANIIGTIVAPELFKAFQFEKARTEAFFIACYNDQRQDFFSAHRDNTSPATAKRKFAISFELNDDYEGGGLVFPEFGDHRYRVNAGGAIVFSCSLMHAAMPVTRGNRYVLLSFLSDPQA